jgi:metal-responsive CopG/Arc/MetJ family transcriptional regulator
MSTTVHLPPNLLSSVDRRARELEMSRNRYIIRALERALHEEEGWSPRFLDTLAAAAEDREGQEAVEEMRAAIAASRTRKAPPEL